MNTAAPTKEAHVAASGGSIHDFRKATRKMRWWYESLADYMIANPNETQNDIAAAFGRNPATISTVINTDAFKAYFRQRRQHHAEKLDTAVRDKLFKVSSKSLDYMLEVLDKKRDTVPLETLTRISDSALKNLGYGVPSAAPVQVNVNQSPQHVHVAVSVEDLERAREALRRNQLAPPPIEAEYTEVEGASRSDRGGSHSSSDETEEARLARGGGDSGENASTDGVGNPPSPKIEDLS
jgi:hypothetical protein